MTSSSGTGTPQLSGDALRAVKHRGSHIQIIASAGSGKTEVVAQRVADLFADGVEPSAVVAFTFTERAAQSLKTRIEERVRVRLGDSFLDKLNGCFVGTIHAYCFRLLQQHVPLYETYDVLDEHRLAAFLTRESNAIEIKSLSPKLFDALPIFLANNEVVDNELLDLAVLDEPFKGLMERFWSRLSDYHVLTYGRIIALAVKELESSEVLQAVHGNLRHLIVDEYQDVNPAQEALVRRLAAAPVELCVVGDDDQSIYQWRGSDVGNIVTFSQRYANVTKFNITVNRRSRPGIIAAANDFAQTIQGRLPKAMQDFRPAAGSDVVSWQGKTEAEEAQTIASSIDELRRIGYKFRDIAVLVRSATSYSKLLIAFESHGIPVLPGDRTGLFLEPDAQRFGQTFAYFADADWRPQRNRWGSPVSLADLVRSYSLGFHLNAAQTARLRERLRSWRTEAHKPTKPANLVGDFYQLLGQCGVAGWDLSDSKLAARMGTLARCSAVLADYESVRRRPRRDASAPGEVSSGNDRGSNYFLWLAIHIQNWALEAYKGFEGEDDLSLDAVDLTTIHKAKGLEWPIVFVPCVSANRFPSSNTGKSRIWHVPTNCFNRTRYEGTENDERRVFYVGITRARDWLSVSTHLTPNSRPVQPSPFLKRFVGGFPPRLMDLPMPPPPEAGRSDQAELLSLTFSELAEYASCGLAYRLRSLIGFQPPLSTELGYGKAVHHVLREVAEHTRQHGTPPSPAQLELLLDGTFFLPAATRATHGALKGAARKLIDRYISDFGDDLMRVWAVERPFELHLSEALVSGRADVILDEEDGVISSLAIVDYKTATDPIYDYDLQLQVYTDAGRREGLTVTAAYVHDLKEGQRLAVNVDAGTVADAETHVETLIARLKAKDFAPSPEHEKCGRCDVRAICKAAV